MALHSVCVCTPGVTNPAPGELSWGYLTLCPGFHLVFNAFLVIRSWKVSWDALLFLLCGNKFLNVSPWSICVQILLQASYAFTSYIIFSEIANATHKYTCMDESMLRSLWVNRKEGWIKSIWLAIWIFNCNIMYNTKKCWFGLLPQYNDHELGGWQIGIQETSSRCKAFLLQMQCDLQMQNAFFTASVCGFIDPITKLFW